MPPLGGSGLEGLTTGGGGGGVPDSPLILQGLGVVGAPELTFIGDLDTGIYSPAADQMGLVAGGIEVARASEDVEGQFIVSPGQFLGSAALPALAIGDGDTGFYETFDDTLFLSIGGVNRFVWADAANSLQGAISGAGSLRNEASSSTNPTLGPNNTDADTGIGWFAADALSIVAGGVEGIRVTEGEGSVSSLFAGRIEGFLAGSAAIREVASTAIVPTVHPTKANFLTGLGGTDGTASLIAGSVEVARARNPLAGDAQLHIDPAGTATLANPSLALDADADTGFWSNVDDTIQVVIGAAQGFFFEIGAFSAATGTGPALQNEAVSATNPTLLPRRPDPDTGIGSAAGDQLDLIAGGLSCMSVRETAAARQIGFYTTAPISLQTGVAVSAAAIHAALVALGLITA